MKLLNSLLSSIEWLNGIIVSYTPCINKQGLWISFARYLLLNLSTNKAARNDPYKSLTAYFKDKKGLSRTNEPTGYIDAT